MRIPGVSATNEGDAYRQLFELTAASMGDQDLGDPRNGTLRALPDIFDEDSYTMAVDAMFRDQRQRQGGAALDTPSTPAGARYADRRFSTVESFEGTRSGVYRDTRGLRTVGVGFNMDQGDALSLWQSAGLSAGDFAAVREGRREMSASEVRQLADVTMERADRHVSSRLQGVDLSEPQRLALVSMAFNAPSLIGPRLVGAIREGNWQAAVNEVLYNSGTQDNGRTTQTAMYRGRPEAAQRLAERDALLGGSPQELAAASERRVAAQGAPTFNPASTNANSAMPGWDANLPAPSGRVVAIGSGTGVAARRYHEAQMLVRTVPGGEALLPSREDYLSRRGAPPPGFEPTPPA